MTALSAKPYRYQGNQGWDPAGLGPIPNPAQRRDARAAEYARLREEGLSVAAASRRLNVTPDTGRGYERARRGRGAS
jgi:hypothetical protein